MPTVLATLDGPPLLLAQPDAGVTETTAADGAANGDGTEGAAQDPGGFSPFSMLLIGGAVILFMIMLGGGSRKQKKKQQAMLSAMGKGDKVVTIGGIKGSIVEVRDDEIVVKIDENNNTRMKFSKEAIREVVSETAEE